MNEEIYEDDSMPCGVIFTIITNNTNKEVCSSYTSSFGNIPFCLNTSLSVMVQYAETKRNPSFPDLLYIACNISSTFCKLEIENLQNESLRSLTPFSKNAGMLKFHLYFAFRRPLPLRTISESTQSIYKFLMWLGMGNTNVADYTADDPIYCWHLFKAIK